MTATTPLQSLYLRRTFWLVVVSVWVAGPAFGLEKNSNSTDKVKVAAKAEEENSDEFLQFEPAPIAKAVPAAPKMPPEKVIEQLEPKVKKDPSDAKSSIELAHAYYDKKDFAKVPPLLWKFVDQLQKTDFYILLRSQNELGQADDLLKVSNLLISRNPKDFEAHYYQGKAYVMKKKDKESLEAFKKAIESNIKHLPSYLSIAEIYEKRKNLYEQRALYQDMLQVFGPLTEILTRLCQVNTQDGFAELGEKYCRQAIQKDPSIAENHVNLGTVILQTGEKQKAKEVFKLAAEKFPKSELAATQYGGFLETEKNYIDSYKIYKTCSDNNPKSEKCLLGYANSSFQIQKLDEAHKIFRKLCGINRNYAVHVRRAQMSLRTSGSKDWANKFQDLADGCAL